MFRLTILLLLISAIVTAGEWARPTVNISVTAPDGKENLRLKARLGEDSTLSSHDGQTWTVRIESIKGMTKGLEFAVAECAKRGQMVASFSEHDDQ